MLENPISKSSFLQTSISRADRLLIAGIVVGIALFWLTGLWLIVSLAASVS